jgi:ribosomal protein S18 acetylase RimI-like enzyme
MVDVEHIVAMQGPPETVAAFLPIPLRTTVRAARLDDIEALVALDRECFDDFWRYGREEFATALNEERLSVVDAEGVVAYSSVAMTGSVCTLGRLAVAESVRRRGIARALIRDAAEWAVSNSALALSLCTQEHNAAARSLYLRAGLAELPEGYAIACCEVAENSQQNP